MGNLSTHFPAASSTNVLEYFAFIPDGRTLATSKGNITVPNRTAHQVLSTTTYTDVAGSVITYTPPDGTKFVEYEWIAQACYHNTYFLPHYYIELDGTAITESKRTNYEYSANRDTQLQASTVIFVDDTLYSDDIPNAKLASWTTGKQINVKMRTYSTTYGIKLDSVYHWNGGGGYGFSMPTVRISSFK